MQFFWTRARWRRFCASPKLGILVSPRTVKKYWPEGVNSGPKRVSLQRWSTFVRNHASALVACDFATVVTATFRRLYVLIVLEIGTRRILYCNLTAHPTAEWTAQQFREAIPSDHSYRFLIHDRDSIFSKEVDQTIENLRPEGSENAGTRAASQCLL